MENGNQEGALASLIIGSISTVGILTKANIFGAPAEIYAAIISLAVFVVVSLVNRTKCRYGKG